MSYKEYIDKNEKYLKHGNTKIEARNIDIVILSIFCFAIGFAGGLMPAYEGLMVGLVFFLLIGLFVFHPLKKR